MSGLNGLPPPPPPPPKKTLILGQCLGLFRQSWNNENFFFFFQKSSIFLLCGHKQTLSTISEKNRRADFEILCCKRADEQKSKIQNSYFKSLFTGCHLVQFQKNIMNKFCALQRPISLILGMLRISLKIQNSHIYPLLNPVIKHNFRKI